MYVHTCTYIYANKDLHVEHAKCVSYLWYASAESSKPGARSGSGGESSFLADFDPLYPSFY